MPKKKSHVGTVRVRIWSLTFAPTSAEYILHVCMRCVCKNTISSFMHNVPNSPHFPDVPSYSKVCPKMVDLHYYPETHVDRIDAVVVVAAAVVEGAVQYPHPSLSNLDDEMHYYLEERL